MRPWWSVAVGLVGWWALLIQADENLVRLYRSLLRDYERDVRPCLDYDQPVNVTFSFHLTQIIDVDERREIITTNAWVQQSWLDYRLTWDPADFDNLTKLHIPFDQLWKPDIILYNNAASEYTKSVMSTDAILTYDGNVSWTMAGIFQSSCGMDVRYYPFDIQNCALKFASWAYDGTKIDILLADSLGDQSNYMINTEWNLRQISAEKNSIIYSCCPEPYPFVDIFITMQRRPMFYVFNLILPCVMISGIALLGFYMPSGAGEKVSLGITSLLSTTVFLMLVAEGMPPTSDALPLLGIYYGATIFIVSLATAMTVFTLNIHHHGRTGQPVPTVVQRVAFGYFAKFLLVKIDYYHSINEHVEYFYTKEHGYESNAAEEKTHKAWLARKFDPFVSAAAAPLSPKRRRWTHGGTKKRVSFENDSLTPNGNTANGHGRLSTRRTAPLANHCGSEGAMAETALCVPNSSPRRSPTKTADEIDGDLFESEFLRVLNRVHAAMERSEMRMAEKDRRNATKLEWQQVALVLDRFLFILFVIGTTLTSLGIIYQQEIAEFLGFDVL